MTDLFDQADLDETATATATAIEAPDRDHYSPAEWQARLDLAVLYRAIHLSGMSDLANGAICARVADRPDHYLTHPYGMFWEEASASSFVTVAPDGTPADDDERWTNDGAINLGRWIFGARPDIDFFVHGHEVPVAAIGSIASGLLPVNQPAVYLGHMLGYLEYEFDENEEFGRLFERTAARHNIIISRNHGYYSLGRNAAEAFFRAYSLKQACEIQLAAMATGDELHLISEAEVARFQEQMDASPHYNYDGTTEWPGLVRKIDRECPGYDR